MKIIVIVGIMIMNMITSIVDSGEKVVAVKIPKEQVVDNKEMSIMRYEVDEHIR